MTIQRAALFAAIGVLLRGVHYWVANMIPSWNSSGVMDQISLAMVSIVDPLVWTLYFVSIWKDFPSRIIAFVAAVLGLCEIGFTGYRQWESLSLESLDTLTIVFGAVLPVILWAVYLIARVRIVLWYLLLVSLMQVAIFVYQMCANYAIVLDFWRFEPFQLLVAPLLWIFYWATQALFIRAAQKA